MAVDTKKKEAKEKKVVIKKEPIPQLTTGDSVKVSMRIIEGGKERIQVFQGIVIKIHPAADGGNFTVRRVAYGVGVERTFPYASPLVARVELLRHGKVRRARLFYLRDLSGKAARIKEKRLSKEKLAMLEAAGAAAVDEVAAEDIVAEEVVADIPVVEEASVEVETPQAEDIVSASDEGDSTVDEAPKAEETAVSDENSGVVDEAPQTEEVTQTPAE